jgi:23S rRNA (adenine2030-N6)-methyltransferase
MLADPSFDRPGEFDRLRGVLELAHRRWAGGTLLAWYPLMDVSAMRRFERSIQAAALGKTLALEIEVHPPDWKASLRGCGLLAVNPPYGLEAEAAQILPWLAGALADGQGRSRVKWWIPEDTEVRR